jgi:mono/diheme cytochrome c family protein
MSTMEGRAVRQHQTWPAVALMLLVPLLVTPVLPAGAQQNGDELTNPLLDDEQAIKEGERIFRSRCTGCHWSPLRAPVLFQTEMSDEKFLETVISGRQGNRGNMPPFGYILSPDDVWKVHAFVMSTDGL